MIKHQILKRNKFLLNCGSFILVSFSANKQPNFLAFKEFLYTHNLKAIHKLPIKKQPFFNKVSIFFSYSTDIITLKLLLIILILILVVIVLSQPNKSLKFIIEYLKFVNQISPLCFPIFRMVLAFTLLGLSLENISYLNYIILSFLLNWVSANLLYPYINTNILNNFLNRVGIFLAIFSIMFVLRFSYIDCLVILNIISFLINSCRTSKAHGGNLNQIYIKTTLSYNLLMLFIGLFHYEVLNGQFFIYDTHKKIIQKYCIGLRFYLHDKSFFYRLCFIISYFLIISFLVVLVTF